MDLKEFALIVFTVLAQLSVGLLTVGLVVRAYAGKKFNAEQVSALLDLPTYAVLPIMVLAMLASLLHLGNLLHVIGAVPNLGTSWMSREVVMAVVYIGLVIVYTFLYWRKMGSEELRTFFGWLAALEGVAFIYSMGMTYMIPAQPAMNTFATPVMFYVVTALLGVLGFATFLMSAFSKIGKSDAALQGFVTKTLQIIGVCAIVLVGIEFLVIPFYMGYLSTQGSAALKSLDMMVGTYGFVFGLRLVLVFAGAGVLAAYLYRNASMPAGLKSLPTFVYSAFLLVLIGELLARFLFYATSVRIGI